MRVDLKREKKKKKILFEVKTKLTNSCNGHGGDERHIMKIDRRMHNRDVKIADLVGKHLQPKQKMRRGW
jgi:hypothetical protein